MVHACNNFSFDGVMALKRARLVSTIEQYTLLVFRRKVLEKSFLSQQNLLMMVSIWSLSQYSLDKPSSH